MIGKTLVEKTSSPASLIFSDRQPALELRNCLDVPVLWVAADEPNPAEAGMVVRPAEEKRPALVGHARFPDDVPRVSDLLATIESGLDFTEPFARIREAMSEARKMGVTGRG